MKDFVTENYEEVAEVEVIEDSSEDEDDCIVEICN